MKEAIIRIEKIELLNFKNVKYGEVEFKKNNNKQKNAEIIGIYGQNGSGKSAVIEAVELVKRIVRGDSIEPETYEYIYQAAEEAIIKIRFSIARGNKSYKVFYNLAIRKGEKEEQGEKKLYTFIAHEQLSYSCANEKKAMRDIAEFFSGENNFPMLPQSRYRELVKNNKKNAISLRVLQEYAFSMGKSYIFQDRFLSILKEYTAVETDYWNVATAIKFFMCTNLFVITNEHTAPIALNLMPFSFRIEDDSQICSGDMLVELTESAKVTVDEYNIIGQIVSKLNIALQTIIPGLSLSYEKISEEIAENNEPLYKIVFYSNRENFKVPLRYESEGIKRIISILNALIAMYNNSKVCLFVDEFDSGIFEYLLGELLQIIEENAKGQLLFTSHNLRALEMLGKDSLVFSTANPDKRFVRFSDVSITSTNNNKRRIYLRSVDLGGSKECIYAETNSYEIAHAFRKAGELL